MPAAVQTWTEALRQRLATQTATEAQEMDAQEVDAAREDVAARLERLARRIRTQTTHATVAQFDEAYSEIVKLAGYWQARGMMEKP
jgi:hypothetical protein